MTEHQGSSFTHSCVKVPVDPYSRQPTPSYERPRIQKIEKRNINDKNRRINFVSTLSNNKSTNGDNSSDDSNLENCLDFLESIPDYGEVNHLSNEQFKRKLDYLKRKQRLLLKNLKNYLDNDENDERKIVQLTQTIIQSPKIKQKQWIDNIDLKLCGKKCSLENSRTDSPLIFSTGTFACLAEDQDLLTYR